VCFHRGDPTLNDERRAQIEREHRAAIAERQRTFTRPLPTPRQTTDQMVDAMFAEATAARHEQLRAEYEASPVGRLAKLETQVAAFEARLAAIEAKS
jgi:hypothetical protein